MTEDISDSLGSVVKGTGILVSGAFASKAIMFFYRLVVARYLGPADYGLLNLGLGVFWIAVSFSHLGFGAGLQRRITHYLGKDDEEDVAGVIWSSVCMTVPWSVLVALVLFAFAEPIAVRFFDDLRMVEIIRIFAVAIPFQLVYKNGAAVVKAFRDMKYITYVDKIFRSLFTFLATVVLLYSGFELMGAVVAQLGAIILSSILIVFFVERNVFPFLRERGLVDGGWLLSYSWPLFLAGIVGLAVSWTDTVLLGFFDTTKSVGVYNAAYPVAQVLLVVGSNFGTMLFPTVSEMYSSGEKMRAREVASVAVKWIFLFTFPAFVIMSLFARPVLRLLFGNVYAAGSLALSTLGAAYLVRSLTVHAGSFIKSEERTRLSFVNSVVTAGLNVPLNFVLIPYFGGLSGFGAPFGAALATAISLCVGAVLAVSEVYYFFGFSPYSLERMAPVLVSTGLSGLAVYSVMHWVFDTVPVWSLVPAFIFFVLLYGLLFVLLGGVEEEDLEMLRRIDEKVGFDTSLLKKLLRKLVR